MSNVLFLVVLRFIVIALSTFCVLITCILPIIDVLFETTGSSSDLVKQMEELLAVWHKQVEQVLTESEQIRREADDVGPSAELQYWKGRMAKFNS